MISSVKNLKKNLKVNIKGSLKSGKMADLVILDKNPLKVQANDIKDIKVLETIKEGRTVFKKTVD